MIFSKGKPSWCEGGQEQWVLSGGELWGDASAGKQQSGLVVSFWEQPPGGFPPQKPWQPLLTQRSGSRERMSRE